MFKIKHISVLLVVLAIFCLIVCVGSGKENPRADIRTVYIKAVADKEFASHLDWKKLIRDIAEQGSDQFSTQLGIELELKIIKKLKVESDFIKIDEQIEKLKSMLYSGTMAIVVACPSIDVLEKIKLKTEIRLLAEHVDFEDCDIVVYFLGKDYVINDGAAEYLLGRRALITHEGGEAGFEKMVKIFVHEIGHLFGAVEFYDENSVMCPGSYKSLEFDEVNEKIIFENKWRNFKKQPEEN